MQYDEEERVLSSSNEATDSARSASPTCSRLHPTPPFPSCTAAMSRMSATACRRYRRILRFSHSSTLLGTFRLTATSRMMRTTVTQLRWRTNLAAGAAATEIANRKC
ncbi:hypothetical protein MRB53_035858 [Persea americana]|uniref:Uncharacterized protein n=1 Tax=Persea americana TaxID=3435 RepID=A0ACC2K5U8_PERAE|nr:hypothetical protein MRB53_035858 [Persea americana]